MENKIISFTEFKALRAAYIKTLPSYMQGLEEDVDRMNNLAYSYYRKGMIPVYARQDN